MGARAAPRGTRAPPAWRVPAPGPARRLPVHYTPGRDPAALLTEAAPDATQAPTAEFMALGAGNVQVCTAAMTHGFKIVEDMISGLDNWMDSKGYKTLDDFHGRAVPNFVEWQDLNMNFKTIAAIDQDLCIQCGKCHVACEDTSHQSIAALRDEAGQRRYKVIDEECVGCNLCMQVCPVDDCITMVPQPTDQPYVTWKDDPRNPLRQAAE